ncbi:MAG: hypothetical protein HFI37_06220 [Lachnospiraceae bacterium]|jgi:MerR family copper efflux transcriptional regulator|nr:hypothetical protein [Lachnospiraceae bacterium]
MDTLDEKQRKQRKIKKTGAIITGVVIILIVAIQIAMLALGMYETMAPFGVIVLSLLVPILLVVGIVYVLEERIKEIEGGEEDEASKY